MASKQVIKIELGSKLDRVIAEVERLEREFNRKVDIYRKRLADELKLCASMNFESAVMDDVVNGSPRKPNVQVSVSDKGNVSVIVADGEDAVWCEFGAGVHHNGSVGKSKNPWGEAIGFTIGSYGKGYGKGEAWGYYKDPVKKEGLVITRGTPASMPMYNAAQEVARKSIEIAREVFE